METKNVADYIKVDTINLNLESKTKNTVIRELYNNLKKTNLIKDEELGLNDIFVREEMGSTGIGKKIALPHAKTKAVDELIATFGISRNGIDYESLDNENVNIEIKPFDAKTYIILTASADSEEAAKDLIKPVSKDIEKRFGNYIYSTKEKISLEMSVVNLLEKNELTISTAESCTGGLLAGRIINVPGVSDVYKEGFITYTNKSKRKTLGVNKSTLKKYGAVSMQTAKEMAFGAALEADTDVSISVTGIAGPDGGTDEKPVGLVYIGVCIKDSVHVEEFRFSGDRANVREQTVVSALGLARKCILEHFS